MEQASGEERLDVAFVVQVGIGKAGGFEEVGLRPGLADTGAEDGDVLLTDWRTDLLTAAFAERQT